MYGSMNRAVFVLFYSMKTRLQNMSTGVSYAYRDQPWEATIDGLPTDFALDIPFPGGQPEGGNQGGGEGGDENPEQGLGF